MQVKLFVFLFSFLIFSVSAFAQPPIINLNQATVKELTGSYKGIGKKRAQAIIDYREQHGGIKSIDELAQVKGFGKKYVEKNQATLKEKFSVQ